MTSYNVKEASCWAASPPCFKLPCDVGVHGIFNGSMPEPRDGFLDLLEYYGHKLYQRTRCIGWNAYTSPL